MTTQKEVEPTSKGCEICKQPTDVLNIIPRDGATFACTNCSKELGMYCDVHQLPHTGFEDGETSACLRCVEEEVQENGGNITDYFLSRVNRSLHCLEILDAMHQYVDSTMEITGASEVHCTARPIVTAAKRFRRSTDEIIAETFEEGPSVLFPWEQED